jgi:hypothetical protein
MRTPLALALATVGTSVGLVAGAAVVSGADSGPGLHQQARLAARSVLGADAVRTDSPPSGAFIDQSPTNTNNVTPTGTPPNFFANQPVQGISAMVPAGDGAWWALADNGYGTRQTSADWQLVIYKIKPNFAMAKPEVVDSVVLSDPHRFVTWQTVCDPSYGTPLPDLDFNVLPAPPAACGPNAATDRILTGFDFDPESVEIGADGSFWIGEEFGPFLLHADRHGRLVEAPIAGPGVKSPQNPTLDLATEQPNVAASRGYEGLAISPDRRQLYAMLEGAVGTDDPQDIRIATFDIASRRFTGEVRKLRLEMPGAKVDLTGLHHKDHTLVYPNAVKPTGTGGESVAELTSVDAYRLLIVERDGNGDGLVAPRFKKVFVLDTRDAWSRQGYVDKTLLVDLMAIPDPQKIGHDGDFFRFPFNTIESVHVVDNHTILVANDNNYPFSNGRARSTTNDRTTLGPDANEMILVEVAAALHPDSRLLPN